jgi:hypothetical protein
MPLVQKFKALIILKSAAGDWGVVGRENQRYALIAAQMSYSVRKM